MASARSFWGHGTFSFAGVQVHQSLWDTHGDSPVAARGHGAAGKSTAFRLRFHCVSTAFPPRFFSKTVPVLAALQEKLSFYLDTVEVKLLRRISRRSDEARRGGPCQFAAGERIGEQRRGRRLMQRLFERLHWRGVTAGLARVTGRGASPIVRLIDFDGIK